MNQRAKQSLCAAKNALSKAQAELSNALMEGAVSCPKSKADIESLKEAVWKIYLKIDWL